MHARPAAITGLGAVSGCGFGVAQLWRGLLSGQTSVREVTRFDHRLHRTHNAAEVPLLEWPEPDEPLTTALHLLSSPAHSSLCDRFALYAAREAWQHSGLPEPAKLQPRLGVFFGSSTGGMLEAEEWFAGMLDGRGRSRISAMAAQQTNAPGDLVARLFRAGGPVLTISSACASATLALGSALDALRAGEVDIAIAGGADSLCQLTYAGFNALRSVDPVATRPFRRDRVGLSLGEGAAVLVLESLEHAGRRGAKTLGLLSGAGAACDAHHMTAPDPSGSGAARAIHAALEDAQLPPAAIDFINAHATGTPHNDVAEWAAFAQVFGARVASIPITATKATVGHFLGSAGAVEAVATVMCLLEGVLHPAPAGGDIDPHAPADLVLGAPRRHAALHHALSTNLAFGGSNGAVVLSHPSSMPL